MADQFEYMSQRFEYLVSVSTITKGDHYIDAEVDRFLDQELNDFGQDGWEVLTISGGSSDNMHFRWLVRFKRRKP
jgi:hypothetical protein